MIVLFIKNDRSRYADRVSPEVEWIEKSADPRLDVYRDVRRGPPQLSGMFLVEGRTAVRTLLEAPGFRMCSLLATRTALDDLGAESVSAPVYCVGRAVMEEVSGVRFHQGCVAAAEAVAPPSASELIERAPARVAVLERMTDPDNVGSTFRNALAFGVDALLLSPGCASPLYRKAIRTSMGATLRLPFAELSPWPDALGELCSRGYSLCALTPDQDARDVAELQLDPAARVALLLGTEGFGLTPGALSHADVRVRIPMSPRADSLNVAAAAAVAMHRLCGPGSG
jgi:tRNA G18 (ribose-2'-O)-methylase SpoU